jgi:hypothetical protein
MVPRGGLEEINLRQSLELRELAPNPGSLSDLGGRYEEKTGLSHILSPFKENSYSI